MKLVKTNAAFTHEDFRRFDEQKGAMDTSAPAPSSDAPLVVPGPLTDIEESPHYSPVVLAGLVRGADIAVLCMTGILVYLAVSGFGHDIAYAILIPIVAVLTSTLFQTLNLNHVGAFREPLGQACRIAAGWSGIVLLLFAVSTLCSPEGLMARGFVASWFAAGLAALLLERGIASIVTLRMTRTGRLERRTVIVGGGQAAEALLLDLAKQKDTGLRICGLFDDRTDDRSPHMVAGTPKLGTIDDLVRIARHTRIDLIIFTLPITAEARLLAMLRKLWILPIDIRLAAHMQKLKLHRRAYSYIGAVPVLDVFDKPLGDWDVVMKTLFDRIVGAAALIALAPVMLVTALAVKLDSPGPVLFRQKRYGFNNELIEIYKFRSMYVSQLDPLAQQLVSRGDPRVTRVGRFIRKTSLDELPQLFNVVFKGNLSLVGPRPHAVQGKAADRLYDEVVDGYFARHRVRPGLTGWAQVNGWRGETDTLDKIQRRVEHDLTYIENWSILFDLYILLVTPLALIKAENAY